MNLLLSIIDEYNKPINLAAFIAVLVLWGQSASPFGIGIVWWYVGLVVLYHATLFPIRPLIQDAIDTDNIEWLFSYAFAVIGVGLFLTQQSTPLYFLAIGLTYAGLTCSPFLAERRLIFAPRSFPC